MSRHLFQRDRQTMPAMMKKWKNKTFSFRSAVRAAKEQQFDEIVLFIELNEF